MSAALVTLIDKTNDNRCIFIFVPILVPVTEDGIFYMEEIFETVAFCTLLMMVYFLYLNCTL